MPKEKTGFLQGNPSLGRIDRVKRYGNSSTNTLREHLTTEHSTACDDHDQDNDITDDDDVDESSERMGNCKPKPQNKMKQLKLPLKQKLDGFEPCSNKYELGLTW